MCAERSPHFPRSPFSSGHWSKCKAQEHRTCQRCGVGEVVAERFPESSPGSKEIQGIQVLKKVSNCIRMVVVHAHGTIEILLCYIRTGLTSRMTTYLMAMIVTSVDETTASCHDASMHIPNSIAAYDLHVRESTASQQSDDSSQP